MPILEIEFVLGREERLPQDLATNLAEAAAKALGSPPEGTWVKLRSLERVQYAEGDGGPPEGVRPVFVSVLRAELPVAAILRRQASRLASAIADLCGRPEENVHVLFEPSASGRIWFGGRVSPGNGQEDPGRGGEAAATAS